VPPAARRAATPDRKENSHEALAVVVAVEGGGLLDVLAHPNARKYPNQRGMIVTWDGYAYLVPYVEEADALFLETVIRSRKATRDYLENGVPDGIA